jgi:hypothetical protein
MAIGIDLDGTLAEYNGWVGDEHIGDVIPSMKEFILELISKGEEVIIFTARAVDTESIGVVSEWLAKNGIPALQITNVKLKKMKSFYDDRAYRVERNMGFDSTGKESKVPGILIDASETFKERNKLYGNAYKDFHGTAMTAFFPEGITLNTKADFNRFATFNAIVAKLGRYSNNWSQGGHKDSAHDIINFAAMLEESCEDS